MTTRCYRQVINEIELALLVCRLFALPVQTGAQDNELEKAACGREPGGEQKRVRRRHSSAEIVQSEFSTDSVVTVIRPHFIADSRFNEFSESNC